MKSKRRRSPRQAAKPIKRKPVQKRDKSGRFNARGRFVLKRGKLVKSVKGPSKKEAAKRPAKKPAKKTRRITLSTVVRKKFSGPRKFEFVKAEQYPVSGTLHAQYTANLDPDKLGTFLDKHGGKSAALILKFKDKDGNDAYRTASSPFETYFASESENADAMLESFYRMLNKYETNSEIGSVDDVQINLFASPKRFDSKVRGKAKKIKKKRKRK